MAYAELPRTAYRKQFAPAADLIDDFNAGTWERAIQMTIRACCHRTINGVCPAPEAFTERQWPPLECCCPHAPGVGHCSEMTINSQFAFRLVAWQSCIVQFSPSTVVPFVVCVHRYRSLDL